MMKAERRSGKAWQRKCVARWRLLSAEGLDLPAAAAEIGVSSNDLAAWSRGSSSAPLLIPVCIKDEAAQRKLVVVLRCGARVEGLSLEDVVELARRLA
jgi:hypothetical protein